MQQNTGSKLIHFNRNGLIEKYQICRNNDYIWSFSGNFHLNGQLKYSAELSHLNNLPFRITLWHEGSIMLYMEKENHKEAIAEHIVKKSKNAVTFLLIGNDWLRAIPGVGVLPWRLELTLTFAYANASYGVFMGCMSEY